jgi:cellobiose-specific phosphotransferase system component IIA
MNKKIIVIIVVLATVLVSGCIKTPMDNINDLIPTLSQNIESGDANYNKAVNYSNNKKYDIAEEKIQTASNKFLDAKNNKLEINKYNDKINDTIYLEYLDLVAEELNLKKDAAAKLQLAIQEFKKGNNTTANSYISDANKIMNQGITIQKQRDTLVKNNPNKFK